METIADITEHVSFDVKNTNFISLRFEEFTNLSHRNYILGALDLTKLKKMKLVYYTETNWKQVTFLVGAYTKRQINNQLKQ